MIVYMLIDRVSFLYRNIESVILNQCLLLCLCVHPYSALMGCVCVCVFLEHKAKEGAVAKDAGKVCSFGVL